jgi:hypothetical protein
VSRQVLSLLILLIAIAAAARWLAPSTPPCADPPAPAPAVLPVPTGTPTESPEVRRKAAEAAILRLPASSVARLPAPIREYMDVRRLRIPQGFTDNVISGEFARRGQTDWAVLASREHVSSILVFWQGRTDIEPDTLLTDPDFRAAGYYRGHPAYFRTLRTETRAAIMKWYGFDLPGKNMFPLPAVEHEGIVQSYGYNVVLLYRDRGEWLQIKPVPRC